MSSLRRAIQVVIVWLTAITVLVASIPHFDCVCPNGNRKMFCLGLSLGRSGCCCDSACAPSASTYPSWCQYADSADEVKHTCCQEQALPQSSEQGSRVSGSCCKKSLADGTVAVIAAPRTAAEDDAGFNLAVVGTDDWLPFHSPIAVKGGPSRVERGLPPPTDLVITLQHFVI